ILRTFLVSMMAFPILEEDPVTRLTTPLGKPACSHSSNSLTAVKGLSLEGLTTTVHPAARAGPILRVSMAAGKFHGHSPFFNDRPIRHGRRKITAVNSSNTDLD